MNPTEHFAAMRSAVHRAPEAARPCQECGTNYPPTKLDHAGHCANCAQLHLNLNQPNHEATR